MLFYNNCNLLKNDAYYGKNLHNFHILDENTSSHLSKVFVHVIV